LKIEQQSASPRANLRFSIFNFQFAIVVLCAASLAGGTDVGGLDDGPCGLLPEAKPQRIKGGEGVPPLPLPATPLRRTERKREPAPPTLVGKLMWGTYYSKVNPDGTKVGWQDWNTDPADIQRLIKFANAKLKVQYRYVNLDAKSFSWDPTEVPVVYVQGRRPITFDDDTRKKIREYVLRGGYLWADACHGAEDFANAFRTEMKTIFPDRPLNLLPPDHPVYRASFEIDHVKYSPAARRMDGLPTMEGIYVGCRTAVFFFPYDLSCAWDSYHVPEGAKCIVGEDAMNLGINLVAYTISYYNLGRYLAQRHTIDTNDDLLKGDFVFAQVKTNGHWDPDPSAFASLLKTTIETTNTKVNFGRKEVPLTDPNLMNYPFLYLTGHDDFSLTNEESAGLKRFLEHGGMLLSDACCGNLGFDKAFRREMKRMFPENDLKELPKDHPVFSSFYKIDKVAYSTQVRASFKDMSEPYLEGLQIGDDTRVIYSRFGLGCGWEGQDRPYAFCVQSEDALKIGVNALMFCITH
jgi:hypothetical protein